MELTYSKQSPILGRLVAFCVLLFLFKLWLLVPFEVIARTAPHDDTLFIGQALSILNGQWLGDYNQFTLMKSAGYPLFIAASNLLGLSLLFSQQLLYASACMMFVLVAVQFTRSIILLIIVYTLLLFNPFTYGFFPNAYPFRFSIYPAVTLFCFSLLLELSIRLTIAKGRYLVLALCLGFMLGWFWHIRGEGIWLAPSIAIIAFYVLIYSWFFHTRIRRRKAIVAGMAVLATFFLWGFSLSTMNWSKYGVFIHNELKSSEFQSAYGGLLRIKTIRWERFIPVNKEARESAYRVSPTFSRLSQYFEEGRGTKTWMKGKPDYPAAYFPWAFRDAVYDAGFYREARSTLDFYSRIGREIDDACEAGKLACRPRYTNLVPTWHFEWNELVPPIILTTLKRMIKFKGYVFEGPRHGSQNDDKLMTNYKYVSLSAVRPTDKLLHRVPDFHKNRIGRSQSVILTINWFYSRAPQVFFVLALFGFGWRSVKSILSRRVNVWDIFSLSILVGLFSYASVLTVVQVTSYTQIGRQLHTTYPLILLFIISVLFSFFNSSIRKDTSSKE